MYEGFLHAHSGLRWIVLILLVLAVAKALIGLIGKRGFKNSDRLIAKFTKISVEIQFVIGLVLYFISPRVLFSSETMSNSVIRFFTVEHLIMMIIAIGLISVGHKKSTDQEYDLEKHKKIAIFYGIALIIILAAIPWPFRGLGSGWF